MPPVVTAWLLARDRHGERIQSDHLARGLAADRGIGFRLAYPLITHAPIIRQLAYLYPPGLHVSGKHQIAKLDTQRKGLS